MATKIAAAHTRLFKYMFVCKGCGQKTRTEALKVIEKKVRCRRCGKKNFRAAKSKKK